MTEDNNFVHFIILKNGGKYIYIYTGKLKITKFYVIDFSRDLNIKSDIIYYFAFHY